MYTVTIYWSDLQANNITSQPSIRLTNIEERDVHKLVRFKVLNRIMNRYGEKISTAVLFEEGGSLRLWEVACYSSQALGLGDCRCFYHPTAVETQVSISEVIRRFGAEALDGFWESDYNYEHK
jgi:hypothetical protein